MVPTEKASDAAEDHSHHHHFDDDDDDAVRHRSRSSRRAGPTTCCEKRPAATAGQREFRQRQRRRRRSDGDSDAAAAAAVCTAAGAAHFHSTTTAVRLERTNRRRSGSNRGEAPSSLLSLAFAAAAAAAAFCLSVGAVHCYCPPGGRGRGPSPRQNRRQERAPVVAHSWRLPMTTSGGTGNNNGSNPERRREEESQKQQQQQQQRAAVSYRRQRQVNSRQPKRYRRPQSTAAAAAGCDDEVLLQNYSRILDLLDRYQKQKRGRRRRRKSIGEEDFAKDDDGTPPSGGVGVLRSRRCCHHEEAYQILRKMFDRVEDKVANVVEGGYASVPRPNPDDAEAMMRLLDRAVLAVTDSAFVTNERPDPSALAAATRAMELQWRSSWSSSSSSSSIMDSPYGSVPKRTVLAALKSWTRVDRNRLMHREVMVGPSPGVAADAADDPHSLLQLPPTKVSFRLLQRLITGRGIRTRGRPHIEEQDFSRVLNSLCDAGEMDAAHRVVALQERTAHAPPVSAVAYTILFKGYGRLSDGHNVEKVLSHAARNAVVPDLVMANGLIDAYVNCGAVDRAIRVFEGMLEDKGGEGRASSSGLGPVQGGRRGSSSDRDLHDGFFGRHRLRPNGRTYNTILKGLAREGRLEEAMELSEKVQGLNFWDHVTTNTLVHASIQANNFDRAERLLEEHTVRPGQLQKHQERQQQQQHPNVEAYTELLDAYAKNRQLDRAVATLQTMRQRGVEPNEITYTCLVAGLGRSRKIGQAKKMIDFMGAGATCVTYNALISSVLEEGDGGESPAAGKGGASHDEAEAHLLSTLDARVDASLKLLRDMLRSGVRPNVVTVSTLVNALGQCHRPRVEEARMLVNRLERDNIIPSGDSKVVTSLVQTCGMGQDIIGALEAFRSLRKADTVAVNAFLDVCCRAGRDRLAFETFDYFFRKKGASSSLKADVISFSVLISSLLKQAKADASQKALALYTEMKSESKVFPDTALVDIILKAFIRAGRSRRLTKKEVYFVAAVLRDAESLSWPDGYLQRRKSAVRAVLADKLRNVWTDDRDLHGLLSTTFLDSEVDPLFKRKGWNKVDSGFKLWGARSSDPPDPRFTSRPKGAVDEFLQSKGWNDVDSGFRII